MCGDLAPSRHRRESGGKIDSRIRPQSMRPSLRRGLPIALLGLFVGAAALAQKTDVLVLQNGDHFTGEIKSYNQGKLAVDTSGVGWIYVKWSHLVSIRSEKVFDVETIDGIHHFGSLAPSDPPGELTIVSGPDSLTVPFFQVFDLAPVFQSFWRRWEGSFDLGFNYTNSSKLVQFNLNGEATFRMRTAEVVAGVTSFFSRQNGETAAERGSVGLRLDRYLKCRWLLEIGVGFDRNIELGLKGRTSIGAGGGRYVVQTNQARLTVFAGFLANREQPVEGETAYTAEATVGGRYSYFMYDFPKITINASVQVYPSLTESGRVRLEAAASAKREIVSDFYLALSVFDSYDSRDPTTLQSKNDWGPTISAGWKF